MNIKYRANNNLKYLFQRARINHPQGKDEGFGQ